MEVVEKMFKPFALHYLGLKIGPHVHLLNVVFMQMDLVFQTPTRNSRVYNFFDPKLFFNINLSNGSGQICLPKTIGS
jgi:hypothetical protein